jgi:hypothetical protein
MLHVGWMHPDHPDLGWQLGTGPLFDGRSDKSKGIALELKPDSELTLPAWEDLIADRLSQFAARMGRAITSWWSRPAFFSDWQARLIMTILSAGSPKMAAICHFYLVERARWSAGLIWSSCRLEFRRA